MTADHFRFTFQSTYDVDNDGKVELPLRFFVYDPLYEESVTVSDTFTLEVQGQPNYCKDVSVKPTLTECTSLGLDPCPNETVFVTKNRLTYPEEGST